MSQLEYWYVYVAMLKLNYNFNNFMENTLKHEP